MSDRPANQIYYFDIGSGAWRGRFHFRIVDWKEFRRARIGLLNACLCVVTHWLLLIFGPARIGSRIEAFPEQGEAGVATNDIFMKKFGIIIYRQVIRYCLHADGTRVTVRGWERYGPIPRFLQHDIEHWGRIHPGGMRSTYDIPMLGDRFTAEYTIESGRSHIESHMRGSFAEAREILDRPI